MTISELSDSALSEWIAGQLEPNPEHGKVYTAWLEYIRDYKQRVWQPRDIVNDPAMTVMLLEQLLNSGAAMSGVLISVILGGPNILIEFGPMQSVECVTLGRAVAEAFCLSSGWKP